MVRYEHEVYSDKLSYLFKIYIHIWRFTKIDWSGVLGENNYVC